MTSPIPYGRQSIDEEDIKAVVETLKADYLTQGPKIAEFEQKFAKYVGSEYAVAVSNGTAALHLSVMALGLQPDEYVICTPITFAASVNCVKYCGGNVLFADIDPSTNLLDLESVRLVLENNQDKKIKGIIPVDFAGRVVELDKFRTFADEHDLWIIEDACHAPGGHFIDSNGNNQNAGNGVFCETTVFSFHPVKHIATGEGGMITTNDKSIYNKLLTLRTHGITRDADSYQNSIDFANGNSSEKQIDYPNWYMEMQDLGYNYRLSDIQAALGITQLKKADKGLAKRREIAKIYTKAFEGIDQIISTSGVVEGHAYHLFVIEVENRRGLYDFLREQNIFAQIHYIPVHLMPYYKTEGWKIGDLPCAEEYYSRCISLPMFPTLMQEEQQRVIDLIFNFTQGNIA
ncbi:MAG: UDP-4-amino-4,6-dideoxy-N-acetyl-beta-L-altrosamine transaminase [Flavobacteriaceae bacterium]|jgi:UDP-4-amino-4,6-dideoxy-N-acetyl-beta-L-altrosamine transaminase